MRHRYAGIYSAAVKYKRGDVVRLANGEYRVFDSRDFHPVAAPPDPSCIGPPGRDGIDGRDGLNGLDGRDGERGADGKDGERGERGKRGPRGRAGEVISYHSRTVRHENSSNDVELLFLEDAHAGEAIYLENDDACGVTNTLSRWRAMTAIGFAVNDTIGGSRGLVRTAGLITVPQTLSPGWHYCLDGRGTLAVHPTAVATMVRMGMAIRSNTLLIGPYVVYNTNHVLTATGSGAKGTVMTLTGHDTVGPASLTDWQWCGLLTADAAGTATYTARGDIIQEDWSAVLESGSTLTPNADYYLADTPGKLTAVAGGRPYIGRATSSTKLVVGFDDDERVIVA